jgi:hypothetical protein
MAIPCSGFGGAPFPIRKRLPSCAMSWATVGELLTGGFADLAFSGAIFAGNVTDAWVERMET